ncbi:MAG TPA: phage/plasmid primase, P4 family [Solirubrobacteraceae bacterium]|nr:phage/plasmid primase, P4 family [Solirubrobacteraceae bacterium]
MIDVDLVLGDVAAAPAAPRAAPSGTAGRIGEGHRNIYGFKYASRRRAEGASEAQIYEELQQLNPVLFETPMEKAELSAMARSGAKYEQGTSNPHRLSETGTSARLAAEYGHRIRFDGTRGIWLVFDDQRWATEGAALFVEACAKDLVLRYYSEAAACPDDDRRKPIAAWARQLDNRGRLSNVISLARSEPGLLIRASQLDTNPLLLNVSNGTIDLTTGQLRPHSPEDFITKVSPVEYDPDARHELWTRVLREATGGDPELEAYVQRWAGYCATGLTHEKAFAFLFGPPDTAKSTILDTIRVALGEYATAVDAATWLRQAFNGGNRGDLARLFGVRLAVTSEFPRGAVFDEALIKRITGGDPLTVAAKYQNEIQFQPTCKLLFGANDAPAIDAGDQGMWNRCRRIPFRHVPPVRDPAVRRRLTGPECGPAVLAWIVAGARSWREVGLGQPRAVAEATAAYRRENDVVGRFLAEECTVEFGARTSKTDLRFAFEAWCRRTRTRDPGTKGLATGLAAAGIEERRTKAERLWLGVRLADRD